MLKLNQENDNEYNLGQASKRNVVDNKYRISLCGVIKSKSIRRKVILEEDEGERSEGRST